MFFKLRGKEENSANATQKDATLEGLKEYICKEYELPSLEKDGAVLNFISEDKKRHSPLNDQDFCRILQQFVSKNNFKLIVVIETPSKAFSDWSFPKHLMVEIKLCQDVTPLNKAKEAMKTIYSYCYLAGRISFYKDNFKLIPEKYVEADLMKGFTQASVQLESTLSRKRKADEIDNEQEVDSMFGIVTNAFEWYFMECSYEEGKISFKLSKPVTVVYENKDLQAKVEKVLRFSK
ncbi:hypothetical protein RclHR1_17130001 [Rhizophagus clarus]|uniref:Crinkler effector protein N-terminal domain-containing protein n=1 Tax=Rhizophagus clarus TaxID=94130 RepID=A0A2Z6QWV7_9GLOM|nr:hypothetical protein RclHR1_17130001 [Rhizophagus clarus]